MLTDLVSIVHSGKKELPDAKLLAEKLLMRRKFIPDPQGTSLMFAFFAQHFTHQFFKSDMKRGPAFTVAKGHGVRRVVSCLRAEFIDISLYIHIVIVF